MKAKGLLALVLFSFTLVAFSIGVSASATCDGVSYSTCDSCCYDPAGGDYYGCDCDNDYYNSQYYDYYDNYQYYPSTYCQYDSQCPAGYGCYSGSCVDYSYTDEWYHWNNYDYNQYDCSYYGNCGYYDSYDCSYYGNCGYYNNYDCSYYGTCGNYNNYNCQYYGNCGYYNYDCSYYGNCQTTCTKQNPSVSISPSSQSGSSGSTLSYTVTVTNNDNSACSSSTFSLTSNCPSGWTCNFDTNSLTISAGSTGSTTIRVTSPSGFSGSNTFSVTANNGCSGTASATYTTSGSTSGNYALSISPSSGNSNDNSYNWYISATDQSTGASSPITYTVTYNTMGTCDSSSYVTPSQFTINQGTTLNNIITVRGVKTSDNYCTISMTIKAPNGATVASGTYTVNQGQNYQQYNYNYPYYNYYPTVYYVTSEPQEAEVAKPTCDSPYEGEIAKAQIFSTSQISTPSEGIYLFVILLIILLLLLALLAYWLLTRSRSGRSNKKDSHSNFKCWSGKNLGRDHPESF